MKTKLITLIFFSLLVLSCQEKEMIKINPLNTGEYQFFQDQYDGNNPGDWVLEPLLSEKFTEKYKGEDASYSFSAHNIKRPGEETPVSVLVEMKIDRLQSSLMGSTARKQSTKYICIPSSRSNNSLHNKYNSSLRDMTYKDYEVYLKFLSKLFSETYLP